MQNLADKILEDITKTKNTKVVTVTMEDIQSMNEELERRFIENEKMRQVTELVPAANAYD